MPRTIAYIICSIMTLAAAQVYAAGDPVAGAQKVQTCAVCHGPNGNSANPVWPKLAGQHPEYTYKQLQDFKSGARANPQMTPMAAPLSEQDMQDIAAYYAQQSLQETPLPSSTEAVTIEAGEKIYRGGDLASSQPACMACHGPAATGNPAAKYPSLAGQHSAYTAAQMQAFRSETRTNDMNNMMRGIAAKLTNEEIEAVSLYIQGLSPQAAAE